MPLVEGAKRSKTTDSGEGSRAATDEEARAMIRHAHYRRASDKRALSARDVYYAALFYTGGRYCEPATWQWAKHVFLEPEKPGDAFVPHLLYEAKHHKAARTEEVPIHPELAAILRHHREWLRAQPEVSIKPGLVRDPADRGGRAIHDRPAIGPPRPGPARGLFQRVIGHFARKNLAAPKPLARADL